jgi:hypothetical protein
MSAEALSDELLDLQVRVGEVTNLAYQDPPPAWALRDVALPLILDMWRELRDLHEARAV